MMPLSKARDKARRRLARLDARMRNEFVQPDIPLYNPSKHRIGDTVSVNGKTVTIPRLDADGQPIYEEG